MPPPLAFRPRQSVFDGPHPSVTHDKTPPLELGRSRRTTSTESIQTPPPIDAFFGSVGSIQETLMPDLSPELGLRYSQEPLASFGFCTKQPIEGSGVSMTINPRLLHNVLPPHPNQSGRAIDCLQQAEGVNFGDSEEDGPHSIDFDDESENGSGITTTDTSEYTPRSTHRTAAAVEFDGHTSSSTSAEALGDEHWNHHHELLLSPFASPHRDNHHRVSLPSPSPSAHVKQEDIEMDFEPSSEWDSEYEHPTRLAPPNLKATKTAKSHKSRSTRSRKKKSRGQAAGRNGPARQEQNKVAQKRYRDKKNGAMKVYQDFLLKLLGPKRLSEKTRQDLKRELISELKEIGGAQADLMIQQLLQA